MRDTLFNDNWRFYAGSDPTPFWPTKTLSYSSAKTESALVGFASKGYVDTELSPLRWTTVNLPHDYLISQDSDPNANETLGFFQYHDGCYRKHFTLDESDADLRVTIYFEGVASKCRVWLNGCFLGENSSAYNSFELELNPYAVFGGENVLVVEVFGKAMEGWWYAGAGIVRNVWLRRTNLVSVDRDGIYAAPKHFHGYWKVPGELTLRNDSSEIRYITVRFAVEDLASREEEITLLPEGMMRVAMPLEVENPKLWDTETPNLYTASVELSENGVLLDSASVRIGFRTAEFTPEGFFLNGKKVRLKGVCCHEDYAITGRAYPYAVKELRLQKLAECGVNAYRCAHYQQSADLMDLMDEHGFLVMAENRHFEPVAPYTEYFIRHLLRDRNHPCIVLWSTSNEESYHVKPQGKLIQHRLAQLVRQYTDTPVTAAVSVNPLDATVYDDCDVVGMNYRVDLMDALAEAHPDKALVMTECVASATTRGWYSNTDSELGYMYGYDNRTYSFGESLTRMEELVLAKPRYAGMFIWAGTEHRGEAYWPRLFSQAGLLDAALHFKDSSYLLRSFWTEKPMVHLLPHWNHTLGETVDVRAYSNCEEVELFINGESQGKQRIGVTEHGKWNVTFVPGELKAIGYRNGERVAEDVIRTAGAPKKLELILENRTPLDGKRKTAVLTCRILDENGNPVPNADSLIRFRIKGQGRILGTFGSVCDHRSAVAHERCAFMGLCSVAVDVNESCEVLADSTGLDSAFCGLSRTIAEKQA